MNTTSRALAPLALALTLTSPAWANPFDPGTPGYKQKHIYVDSAFSCLAPANCGSQSNPYRKLSEAMAVAQSGDEVIIAGRANRPYYLDADGIGSDTTAWPTVMSLNHLGHDPAQRRLLIRAWQGMPKPIIRGTVALNGWTSVSGQTNVYSRPWPYVEPYSTKAVEPEQAFRGATALTQIGGQVFGGYNRDTYAQTPQLIAQGLKDALTNGISDLWPGYTKFTDLDHLTTNQFYFDRSNRVVYVKLDSPLNAGERIEVSARQFLLNGSGASKNDDTGETWGIANVTLQDLVFERSNTSHYWRGGAVLLNGTGLIVNRVDFRDSDSHCLQIEGNNNLVSNSTFTRCGQVGLVANGNGNTIQSNYFTLNNNRGFDFNWEAGPTKFIGKNGLTNSIIKDNVVANNKGHGIWLDTHNNGNLINNNVSAFNQIGVFLENSSSATISNNVIFGNRNQGIQFRGSPYSTIKDNILVGNNGDGVFMQASQSKVTTQDANGVTSTKIVDNVELPTYASKGISITGNVFAWHDEAWPNVYRDANNTPWSNWKPVWVTPGNTINSNRYCGSQAGSSGSLHFWVWKTPDSDGLDVLNWQGWQARGYDTVASQMVLAAPPAEVNNWHTNGQAINTSLYSATGGTAYSRTQIRNLVQNSCGFTFN